MRSTFCCRPGLAIWTAVLLFALAGPAVVLASECVILRAPAGPSRVVHEELDRRQAESDLSTIAVAISLFRARHGVLEPRNAVAKLVERGFLRGEVGRDPWGRAYRVYVGGHGFEVHSDGPDGVPGTKDDLVRAGGEG